MSDEMRFCEVCALSLPEGVEHENEQRCIRELQAAMVRQREAAAMLGSDISVRFLHILKGLCNDDSQFEAILEKYQSQGDWSPMQQTRDRLHNAQVQVRQLMWMVENLLAKDAVLLVPELEQLARDGIEQLKQLRIRPLDPRLER